MRVLGDQRRVSRLAVDKTETLLDTRGFGGVTAIDQDLCFGAIATLLSVWNLADLDVLGHSTARTQCPR